MDAESAILDVLYSGSTAGNVTLPRPWFAVLAAWLALVVVLAANVAHYAQAFA